MRRALWLLAFAAAPGCVVPDVTLDGLPCDPSGGCLSGYVCVNGACVLPGKPGGADAGVAADGGQDAGGCDAPPSCSPDGWLALCDGGLTACADGGVCDLGSCRPACLSDGGCGNGSCDQALGGCVPASPCQRNGDCLPPDVCLGGVCLAPPPAGSGPNCAALDAGPADAGGMVTVSGPVTLFPDNTADPSLDGGIVVFFGPSGEQLAPPVTAVPQGGAPWPVYQLQLPAQVGPVIAAVTSPGVGAITYFPNLVVRGQPGQSLSLGLYAVVSQSKFLANVPALTGVTPQAGHLTWVGQAARCDVSAYLQGFTVGLSPAPGFLGYYGSSYAGLSPSASSSSSLGSFVAVDAPYGTTSYALAYSDAAGQLTGFLQGTFTPPPFTPNRPIAVALLYPGEAE